MRGVGRAVVAVLIAAAVVLAPSPALAVQPVPPPVTPLPGLPSTTLKGITNAGGVGNANANFYAWMLAQLKNSKPGAKPVPVSAPQALTKVSGGPLVGGFMLGWTITDGVLAAYGAATGTNPLDGVCNQAEWLQVVVDYAYMMSAPDCQMPVVEPNADVAPGEALTYGAFSARFAGKITYPTYARHFVTANAALPANTRLWYLRTPPPDGQVSSFFTSGTTFNEGKSAGLYSDGARVGIFDLSGGQTYGGFQLRSTTTGEVLVTATQQTANPQRQVRCEIGWEDGTVTEGFDAAAFFTEETGIPFEHITNGCQQAFVSKPGAGPDLLPSDIKVGTVNTETGAQTEISQQTVPEYTEAERKGLDAGDGTGLKLWKITAAGKSSCMTWAADCRGWWTKTAEGTSEGTGAEKFRCEFGGKKVAIGECGVYRNTFEEQTDNPKITDPEDGESKDWQTELEGTGNSTDPGSGPTPGDRCFEEWGEVANPIEWVFQPVKCALVWAFVPRTQVVTATTTGITNAWETSALGAWTNTFTSWSFIPPPAGCDGIEVPLGDVYGHGVSNFRILKACAGDPLQPVAILSSVVLGISAVLALIWVASGSIGSIVGFRGLNGGGN